MAVTENDRIVGPVTPAAATTLISVDFYFEDADDLEVFKSGSETALVRTVDYTVALPSGVDMADGSITLLTPANGTDAYSIFGTQPLERSSDFQFRSDIRSPVLNVELNRIWRALQTIRTTAQRTINLSRTSPELPPITFTPGSTNGRAIVFNGDSSALVPGATADEIAGAQAAATAAAASAAAAAASAVTASDAADLVGPIAALETEIAALAAVAAEIEDLGPLAPEIAALGAVATELAAVAAIVADVTAVAAIDAAVTQVANLYQGAAASDPTVRTSDGSPLQVGDFYLNTTAVELRYVVSTGPVVWTASRVPAGGTTGQVLSKTSDTDLDVEWADAASGGTTEEVFDADGTWDNVYPANALVKVMLWSAGQSGTVSTVPGAGGNYIEKEFLAGDLPSSVAITVGPSSPASNTAATRVGAETTFGALLTAPATDQVHELDPIGVWTGGAAGTSGSPGVRGGSTIYAGGGGSSTANTSAFRIGGLSLNGGKGGDDPLAAGFTSGDENGVRPGGGGGRTGASGAGRCIVRVTL